MAEELFWLSRSCTAACSLQHLWTAPANPHSTPLACESPRLPSAGGVMVLRLTISFLDPLFAFPSLECSSVHPSVSSTTPPALP